jgi:hypothetical protein
MRQGTNPRRVRSRNNGKRHPSARNSALESNGPEVKVRGTAQQVLEKYLALARDASSTGDRVAAENYFQHAEHYYRVINAEQNIGQPSAPARGTPADAPEATAELVESESETSEQPAVVEAEVISA